MAINTYAELGLYINGLLTPGQKSGIANSSPHGAMWDELQYVEFVEGNVPGVTDPTSGDPMPILVKGNAAQSNLIKALQGAPGTPFDPSGGAFGPMPAIPPLFTPAQIQPIIDWINAGCPQ